MQEVVKTKAISKILAEANDLPTVAEKVTFLRKWDNAQLREIIRHVFDPNIKYDISIHPEAKEPDDWSSDGLGDMTKYRPLEDNGTNEGAFIYETRKRLIYLIEGGPGDVMSPDKRNALFHNILESINPTDAELLLSVKDKEWPYDTLSPTVLIEAFPGLIPTEVAALQVIEENPLARPRKKPEKKKTAKKVVKTPTKKKATTRK